MIATEATERLRKSEASLSDALGWVGVSSFSVSG